jgi:hypothetical protein
MITIISLSFTLKVTADIGKEMRTQMKKITHYGHILELIGGVT